MTRAALPLLALLLIGCGPKPTAEEPPAPEEQKEPEYTLEQARAWVEKQDWSVAEINQRTGIIGSGRRPVLDFVIDARVDVRIIQLRPSEDPEPSPIPTIGRCGNLSIVCSPIPWAERTMRDAAANPGSFQQKYGIPYEDLKPLFEATPTDRQKALNDYTKEVLQKLQTMNQDPAFQQPQSQ